MHLTSSPAAWYAARAGGVVAYLLLTAVVLLGLQMSAKRKLRLWPRIAIEDVHRFAAFAAGSFVVIHILAIAIDSYLPFSLSSLVVPFTARYRAAWTGLGVVAAELLIALAITNFLRERRRLDHATWRRAHYLNFAVWGAATAHGLGTGTDRSSTWLLALYAAATASVAGLTAWRILRTRPQLVPALPVAAAGLAACAAVALGIGPLRAHAKPWNAARFDDTLDGRISRQAGQTRGIVSFAGQGTGDQRVLVRADLLIAPGRLLGTSFQMEYLPSGQTCRGSVARIDDDGLGFLAHCRLPGAAQPRTVQARWLNAGPAGLEGGELRALS